MRHAAVGAFGAEPERVVNANLLVDMLGPVPVVAGVAANLAEASFEVRARLLLLRGARFRFLRVSVDALSVLLVAVTALFEKPADGNLLLDIHVKVLARVALAAHFFEPMHADLLLELGIVGLRIK